MSHIGREGPRSPDNQDVTGTGTPRSADTGVVDTAGVEDPIDELDINRSGSGGTGGATTDDEQAPASRPASMDELLTGEPSA